MKPAIEKVLAHKGMRCALTLSREEVEQLVEVIKTLEWYADNSTTYNVQFNFETNAEGDAYDIGPIAEDNGEKARAALGLPLDHFWPKELHIGCELAETPEFLAHLAANGDLSFYRMPYSLWTFYMEDNQQLISVRDGRGSKITHVPRAIVCHMRKAWLDTHTGENK
jgi:hypothetical protein